jgi:hypothetical protein
LITLHISRQIEFAIATRKFGPLHGPGETLAETEPSLHTYVKSLTSTFVLTTCMPFQGIHLKEMTGNRHHGI